MAKAKKSGKAQSSKAEPPPLPAALEPLKQFFEKKLRNLEKRKGKLDNYKLLQEQGKLTDPGQQQAVMKYDEVLMMIKMVAEIQDEMMPIIRESGTTISKELSSKDKEIITRSKMAIRTVLDVQDIFEQLGDEQVRTDFTEGNKGAQKLSTSEIEAIDELYGKCKPSRSEESGAFVPPEEFSKRLDASTNEFNRLFNKSEADFSKNLKYNNLAETLLKVSSSQYFDPSHTAASDIPLPEAQNVEDMVSENPNSAVDEDLPVHQSESENASLENGHIGDDLVNGDRKRTASEVLGSLQQKSVISFVQDDMERNGNDDPAVIMAHPMAANHMSMNSAFPAKTLPTSFENDSFETYNLNSNNVEPPFNQYSIPPQQNQSMYNMADMKSSIQDAVPPPMDAQPFAQQSWADEVAGDAFETHLNNPDNFVEVKYGQRGNVRGGNPTRGDYKQDGRGRYSYDFNRGSNRGSRGFDNTRGMDRGGRGSFDRPFRQDFNRDGQDSGFKRDDATRGRSFGGRADAFRGQGRGGRARNFDRPYQGRE